MAIRVCPECRHEITGQKYCIFCGCDLRKTGTAVLPEKKETKRDESLWNPEEGYRRASAGRKVFLLFAIVILAAACVVLAAYVRPSPQGGEIPVFRAGMNFEEAARAAESCGYRPDGLPSEGYRATTQYYQSREVYGYTTDYSILQVEKGEDGEVTLAHYYQEAIVSVNGESRKKQALKKTMSNLYGDPEYAEGIYPYYWWRAEDGGHFLYSTGDLIVAGSWTHR